jgi:hypothetical protein
MNQHLRGKQINNFMRTTFVVLAMLASASSFAQSGKTSKPGQSFFAELQSPGIFSANYDRRFTKSAFGFGARVGVGFATGYSTTWFADPSGYYHYEDRRRSVLTIPVQVNYLFGKPSSTSAFEVGAGAIFTGRKLDIFDDNYNDFGRGKNISAVHGTASFMYRRMPKDGGFSWRAGFTPTFSKNSVQAGISASVGYNF